MISDYILVFAGLFLIIYACAWLVEKERTE